MVPCLEFDSGAEETSRVLPGGRPRAPILSGTKISDFAFACVEFLFMVHSLKIFFVFSLQVGIALIVSAYLDGKYATTRGGENRGICGHCGTFSRVSTVAEPPRRIWRELQDVRVEEQEADA